MSIQSPRILSAISPRAPISRMATLVWLIGVLFVVSLTPADESTRGFQSLLENGQLTAWRGRPQLDPRTEGAWSPEELKKKQASWDEEMHRHWRVEPAKERGGPEIVSDGEGVFLTSARDYHDFEFMVDWKMVAPGADSGIYLRACPQVQIWDPNNPDAIQHGADRGSGALWNNDENHPGKWPLVLADQPVGEWNATRIRMIGSRVWVWLNDKLTVDGAILDNYWDRTIPVFDQGCLQLQTHGGEFRFRRPAIRSIPAEEANEILRELAGRGFEPIWDGRSLDGWRGPVDQCEIVDGALIPRHGTIFTEREFQDFDMRLEFQLPPGGNNGLGIRYPSEGGDAAYDGLCELQILDNEHDSYRSLDPRQYHGSAYGMVPAHRGYLRETGQWNFQRVRVQGSQIYVELNGTPILDADIANVRDFLDDRPHPGKDRLSGHLGLCGHDSPVRFRNLAIREIPPRDN
jgi:hypothetical protein